MQELAQEMLDVIERPAPNPTTAPSNSPSPRPPKSEKKRKKEDTCIDRRPLDAEDNDGEGWTYYSPIGFRERADGAAVCLKTSAEKGTGSNSNSPGMKEAKELAAELFPNTTERFLVNSCHLIPDTLGGRGITANLSPCWTKPINVPKMTRVANCVAGLMRSGIVQMIVKPRYQRDTDMTPYSFTYTVKAWDKEGHPKPEECSANIVNEKEEKLLNGHN
jgi:hypothetical protein